MNNRRKGPPLPRLLLAAALLLGLLGRLPAAGAQEVNFDFENADLRAVIQAVSEFTGRNFLVDPRVKGKVTVVAPSPLTEEEAFKTFQSVLEVNGYVTVEGEGATKIVPQEEGKHRALKMGKGEEAGDEMVTRVLRLEHVSAQRMVPILRPLVPPYGHLVAYPDTSSLIITDRGGNLDRLVSIIDRLDRPTADGEVEIVPLAHASAKELADMLGRLYSEPDGGNQQGGQVTVMADERTNSLILKADKATRKELENLAKDLDSPTGTGGNTRVIYLKNADAEELVDVLQTTVQKEQGGDQGQPVEDVTIKADAQTNALVVRASKSDFQTIQKVVNKLDVRRLQVYVEGLIAEVSTDTAQEFGIQWQAADGLQGDNQGIIGTSSFTVGDNIQGAAANPVTGLGAGLSIGFVDGTLNIPGQGEVLNMPALIRALESRNDSNVLSTPNLLTMDNEKAEIVVGQNVPFVTGSFSSTDSGTAVDNPFQTIERKDVGLTLRITPQITEGSAIKMKIYQEVSSVSQRGEAQDIVTNKRSLETTVVAENNKLLVLGGLIQEDNRNNVQEVPVLSRIPLLGNLFRYKSQSRTKTNLMVFLRPRIIRGAEDMAGPTREKYGYIQDLRKEQGLMEEDEEAPPMEEWQRIGPQGEAGSQAAEAKAAP